MGFHQDTCKQWIARGQALLERRELFQFESNDSNPPLNIESTELTVSVPGLIMENEQEAVQLHRDFCKCPAFGAFRVKLPWTLVREMDRYAVVSTAVSIGQTLQEESALDFVFATIQEEGKSFVKGVDFHDLFDTPEKIVLLPTLCLNSKDLELAHQALEFYPPIVPIPFEFVPTRSNSNQLEPTTLNVYTRDIDWNTHETTVRKWCTDYHYQIVKIVEQVDFDKANTVIVQLQKWA